MVINDDFKLAILHQLPSGRAHAISGKILAQRLSERNTRQIRLAIQKLIEDGFPIIGTSKPPYGYFIAESPQDCQECLMQLRSYGLMLFRHYKYLKQASIQAFGKQLPMKLETGAKRGETTSEN